MARTQWAIVVTLLVTTSNLMSVCGLVAPAVSETVAAALVKPVSFTYCTALLAVRPGVSRSRTVRRRWPGAITPGIRSGTIRSPAEPLASVVSEEMIDFTSTLARPRAVLLFRNGRIASLVTTCSPSVRASRRSPRTVQYPEDHWI